MVSPEVSQHCFATWQLGLPKGPALVIDPSSIDPSKPVLIAGPTASGKSGLALDIAEKQGGTIVNADALQVYANWRVLTARPPFEDEARAPHVMYGHIAGDQPYSVGDWLREVQGILATGTRPIIVGGTGLYFKALTEGLAHIPPTPQNIRDEAMRRIAEDGAQSLLPELDDATRAKIDTQNPMRVQRAWEVLTATGKPLIEWQKSTTRPVLPLTQTTAICLNAPKEWLTPRIEQRFDLMLDQGALEEARDNAPSFRRDLPSAKTIGAAELVAHVKGELGLDDAREASIIQTRQYAKRQRTWFKANMKTWLQVSPARKDAA